MQNRRALKITFCASFSATQLCAYRRSQAKYLSFVAHVVPKQHLSTIFDENCIDFDPSAPMHFHALVTWLKILLPDMIRQARQRRVCTKHSIIQILKRFLDCFRHGRIIARQNRNSALYRAMRRRSTILRALRQCDARARYCSHLLEQAVNIPAEQLDTCAITRIYPRPYSRI